MRSKIIPNFGVIVTSVDGDYNLAQKWYNVKGRQENVFYPFGLSDETD